jgi:hypothetical protein
MTVECGKMRIKLVKSICAICALGILVLLLARNVKNGVKLNIFYWHIILNFQRGPVVHYVDGCLTNNTSFQYALTEQKMGLPLVNFTNGTVNLDQSLRGIPVHFNV